ncbi:MAG: signal recognition particle-docking protein FtsY [Rhodospirillaceae bacterium]|nr:signal recognition particle-docking protein FtsY [Rhodospirillaceae bacterium]|tara:strand:+ start:3508 stop:4446 length:939 start_codon:yes stop_codon:yes gene_type:complete
MSENNKRWISRLRNGLGKSSNRLVDGISSIFSDRPIDAKTLEELEDLLISADLGVDTANKLIENISKRRFSADINTSEIRKALANDIVEILGPVARPLDQMTKPSKGPQVILLVGTNGTGKTTTIGKLAKRFQEENKSVVLAAGDTFRAAAVDQLKLWGERTNAAVISQNTGSDPAAVAYEALEYAIANNKDVLLIDTAGRLHNKENLMSELEKVVRVLRKIDEEVPQEIILILDATTGQNAHIQVETFKKLINISGLIVTKLDGSARGGVIVALADRFSLPIFAIGVGEEADDLRPFTAQNFADSLLELPR